MEKRAIRPVTMGTRSVIFFFQKHCFQETAVDFLVPPLWEKGEKIFDFLLVLLSNGCRQRIFFFIVLNCQHAHATIDRRSRHKPAHGQPALCRARSTSEDDGLEEIRWIHGLGGKSLQELDGGVLRYPLKREKKSFFWHSRRI